MSEWTPGRAKTCGCRLEPVADDRAQESDLCSEASGANNGMGWVIAYCPTHALAPEMAEALRRLPACDHRLDEDRHAFEFAYHPNRNIWNPFQPTCSKCGESIGHIMDLVNQVRAVRAKLDKAALG